MSTHQKIFLKKKEKMKETSKKRPIKKESKSPKHPKRLCWGIFVQKQQGAKPPCFISYNLSNLGKLGFGEPEEKTPGSH